VRAEIDAALVGVRDEDEWIRDLETRLAQAAEKVRRQRLRAEGHA
jgi:hypothetical protein